MTSQFILSGPELPATRPDISLGRHLYGILVNNGNKVAMVGVAVVLLVIALRINICSYSITI